MESVDFAHSHDGLVAFPASSVMMMSADTAACSTFCKLSKSSFLLQGLEDVEHGNASQMSFVAVESAGDCTTQSLKAHIGGWCVVSHVVCLKSGT